MKNTTDQALDDIESNPDEHVGVEVTPEHDLDVNTFPEDES